MCLMHKFGCQQLVYKERWKYNHNNNNNERKDQQFLLIHFLLFILFYHEKKKEERRARQADIKLVTGVKYRNNLEFLMLS